MSLRSRLGFTKEPLYLMDGSAFIFRSYYAYRNMTRSDGFPTNALYIVARLILRLLREERPTHLVFIIDGKKPGFRKERFPAYKAQRSATPEPLTQQIAPLLEFLEATGVPVIISDGCEADDCIASLALRYRDSRPVVVLGADKDLKQCLHHNVVLWDPVAKDEKITTLEDFQKEAGMEPSSWPDYQALVGDSSDNIPGVPQVGPKTALDLIQKFPTLEELFDRLAAVPPKVRNKLEGQRDNAMLYRQLTRLQCDVCSDLKESSLAVKPAELGPILRFMSEYEFRSLAREAEAMARTGLFSGVAEAKAASAATTPPSERSSEKKVAGGHGFLAGSASGPQPVAPSPAPRLADAPSMTQGSLLATSFQVQDIPVAASLEELPLFADGPSVEAVALLPQKKALLVAAKDWERLYTGSVKDLAKALSGMAEKASFRIVATDTKSLCKANPDLWAPPMAAWFDLSLAAYLLSPEDRTYSWEHVAARWGEQTGSGYTENEHPGLLALALERFMSRQLTGAGLAEVFTDLELPLVPVLARMEERGVTMDQTALAAFLADVQKELDQLTGDIHKMAGKTFNIRSSQQLSDLLFSILELPKSGKTKGGLASTSQEALEKLSGKHPIVAAVLEYRKLEKMRSTYLAPLPLLADDQDRIHTTFNQTATATGRLSSSNPNLQNIPVRGPLGRRMRACFIAAKGNSLISADYSQVELRVLAHLSGDPTLLRAFRNREDIHTRTAGLLFDVDMDKVTPEQRRSAKTINFGLIYGMGAQKLGRELGLGLKEAKAFIDRYFERLTTLKKFYDSIEEEARQNGFVTSMAGRRRFTPDILSQNNQLRAQARRQAINMRTQGSAADIIKLAMLAVENDAHLRDLGARLLLQIHDELLLEAPKANAEKAGKRLATLMEEVAPEGKKLAVPLSVDWGVGNNWAEAH